MVDLVEWEQQLLVELVDKDLLDRPLQQNGLYHLELKLKNEAKGVYHKV